MQPARLARQATRHLLAHVVVSCPLSNAAAIQQALCLQLCPVDGQPRRTIERSVQQYLLVLQRNLQVETVEVAVTVPQPPSSALNSLLPAKQTLSATP